MKNNDRLLNFETNLMQRLSDIKDGYVPECENCFDLDYTLDSNDPRQPTICIPCAVKNMHKTKKRIKDILKDTDKDINKGGKSETADIA